MTKGAWWRARRSTIATVTAIALVAGGTLTVAALHPGFPVADVELTSRDVWVTNGELLRGGRLNKQIDELNASVTASSPDFDVLQDGDALFLVDPDRHRLESVDPASTAVTSSVDLPADAEVDFGGDLISVVANGRLWALPAVGDLQLDTVSQEPLLDLGPGGHAVVTAGGEIVAVSPTQKTLYRIPSLADVPVASPFPAVGEFQLAAIGERVVVLDSSTNQLITQDGTVRELGADRALKLQQSGPASDVAVLATADALLRVRLDSGEVERIDAEIGSPATADDVAAPVNDEGCAHGAWASGQRYLYACEGQEPMVVDIEQPTAGGRLEFRVNRSVIVLNDLSNGNVWIPAENLRLVDNWDDVIPPEQEETEEEGDDESALQSFEDTLAERTETNRPPTAVDDEYGIRPGRTTIVAVLDNDSDPDGDVLVISDHSPISESTGHLDYIDGRRALQFTPNPSYTGGISFSYTADDGRGGTATADVFVRVVPDGVNALPVELRTSATSVEANQTISYNVLANWRDPDGDDLFLQGAAPTSGDLVRFTPDGVVTFTHQTSELGEKEVSFIVADGSGDTVTGSLVVDVKPAGSLKPVGTPDFATVFAGEQVTIKPLENDLSPSGAVLSLTSVAEPGDGATVALDTDKDQVQFSASEAGIYYLEYTLAAGSASSVGIIRIDVTDASDEGYALPIAVKDTAYLRSDEPTTVSVLTNDVSPTGRILAVHSVSVPADVQAKGVVVELLESTLIRVTSPQALTTQIGFSYTISDGIGTATAGVTIVPVPPLTKHQPPIARDDDVTVRSGDIVTVDVLDNDEHPDGSRMFLADELVTEPTAGIAFVNDDTVRFQAPEAPGQYQAAYRVLDAYGESAAATVTFTVTPVDEASNRAPRPEPVIARVLSGGSIRVELPLQRIDPDGDSVQLLGTPTSPTMGSIEEMGSDYLVYSAFPGMSGTDAFSYQVYDAFGLTGTASIRIAVIQPPDATQNPSAVPDSVSVRPGRIAQVDLTANDSDPQGSPIHVEETLIEVPEGVEAEVVERRYLVIHAPNEEGTLAIRYKLANELGGSSQSYVMVQVTPDAPLMPPTANDLVLALKDIAGETQVTVDVFDGSAFNPSGPNSDLVLSLEGPYAGSGVLDPDRAGRITVQVTDTRQAIAYRVTDAETGLAATAFILVPAAVDDDFDEPPYIDPTLPTQYVSMNESREWDLADLVKVPSGREAWIPDASTVTSLMSDGSPNYVDRTTIRYQGGLDYRGPASVTFTVTDGASKDDPKGNTIALTLPIVVGDPQFRDTPPTFTTPSVQVEVGETATIDLRGATGHPNPQILQEVGYSEITGTGPKLDASLSGSELTVSTPRNTPKGTSFELGVTLRWDKFTVPGTIQVIVVGSTRPPVIATDDAYETQRGDGIVITSPLGNDFNPYASTGELLRIVDAQVQNTGEPAGIAFTDDEVRISPSPSLKSGTISVVYTVEDATEDPDRRVNGLITLVVSDVPDETLKPSVPSQGDEGSVQITFAAPAANGKPITSYEVRSTPTATMPTSCTPPSCLISGLTNGTPYQFSVRAINEHGPGLWSVWSDAVIPYGTPGTPVVTIAVADQWAPDAVISGSWAGVSANGGSVEYDWRLDGGSWTHTTGTSTGNLTVQGGTHTIEVRAVNSGGKYSTPNGTATSANIQTMAKPPTPGNLRITAGNGATSPATMTWEWNTVTASPGGTTGLRYEVSINGGSSWVDRGTATSYSRSGLGAGTYTLRVRAVNKAGTSASSSDVAGTVKSPPPVPSVTPCFRGTGGTKYFSVRFSGLSGGTHWFRTVDSSYGDYSDRGSRSGVSGSLDLNSWINYSGPGDPDGNRIAWIEWSDSGSQGPWSQGTHYYVRDIPGC